MEFNLSKWSRDKVNVENKSKGLEITPLNFKGHDFQSESYISDILINNTPAYCKWTLKKELKERFESDLKIKLQEVERLKMLIKICSRKKAYLKK